MIYLLTGLPGHGKTYFTVARAGELLAHPGRTIYSAGIPELQRDWPPTDPDTWYNLPEGSAIVIDEAQNYFRPLPAGAERPRKITQLETHRHKGMDIWLITQHPNLLDSHVRRLVGKHFHVHRPFGLARANVWAWEKAANPDDYHEKKLAVKSSISFKPDVWRLYKSANVHTVKRRLPWKLVLLPVALACVGALAWFGYSTLRGSAEPKKTASVVSPSSTVAPNAPAAVHKAVQRIEAMLPIVPDLPHSAARYEGLTAAVAVPVVRGCMADHRVMPPKCWCVSQRGTRMDVSTQFCEAVLENGRPFYDFEPEAGEQVAMPARSSPPPLIPPTAQGQSSPGTVPKPPTPLPTF